MTQAEFFEKYNKLVKDDPKRADAIFNAWKEDKTRSWDQLETLTDNSFKGRVEREGKVRVPLAQAFNVSEDHLRELIDPNSKNNWMTLGGKELLKAAINGGYVKELTGNATDEERLEQRKNFGTFLNMLRDASTDQGHRNAVAEYNNVKFLDDPRGWIANGINKSLFRTFNKRMIEQALKGEGPASIDEMSLKDAAALGGDIAAGAAMGAGGLGAARGITALMGNPLRSYAAELGGSFGAGALGGAGYVLNRALNTEDGARPYEWVTEPVLDASLNAIAAPAFLRSTLRNAGRVLQGAKIGGQGGVGVRGALKDLGEKMEKMGGWDEPALNSLIGDMKQQVKNNDIKTSPLGTETKQKIDDMFAKYNEGLVDEPGMDGSLFDALQRLYDESGVEMPGLMQLMVDESNSVMDGVAAPSASRFLNRLNGAIADLEQAVKNERGTSEGAALQKQLDYFKNFRDLAGSGLVEPGELLMKKDPVKLVSPTGQNTYVFEPGKAKKAPFEIKDKELRSDIDFIEDYIDAVNNGQLLQMTGEDAVRLSQLAQKYPQFGNWVDNLRTVNSFAYEAPMSRSSGAFGYNGGDMPFRATPGGGMKSVAGMGPVAYGRDFVPSKSLFKAAFDSPISKVPANAGRLAQNYAKSLLEASTQVAKPMLVNQLAKKYDKPDTSFDVVSGKYEKLMAEKPEATQAALDWKFDPALPSNKQLTAAEREIINQYRDALRKRSLGEE